MKLWQDQTVVKALQHILAETVRCDMLKVKVPDSSPKRTSVGKKNIF